MLRSIYYHCSHYIYDHLVQLYHNLSTHPEYGVLGGVLSWVIAQIPVSIDAQYQNTPVHLIALYVKDFGVIATGLLAILSLLFFLKKKLIDDKPSKG